MNPSPSLVWNDLPDDSCGTVLSFCAERGGGPPPSSGGEPGSFQWYEQDPGDEVADEVLAWASAEERKPGREASSVDFHVIE